MVARRIGVSGVSARHLPCPNQVRNRGLCRAMPPARPTVQSSNVSKNRAISSAATDPGADPDGWAKHLPVGSSAR